MRIDLRMKLYVNICVKKFDFLDVQQVQVFCTYIYTPQLEFGDKYYLNLPPSCNVGMRW